MSGTFSCCPIVCELCGNAAEIIQRKPADSWSAELDRLPDTIQGCVREYLRGIYQRGQVAERAKAQLGRAA